MKMNNSIGKTKVQVFLLLVIVLVITSFQLPESLDRKKIPPLVLQRIDEEVRQYYADRMNYCRLDALVRAEDYVDSIFVNRINNDVLRGLRFPSRPVRPTSPGVIKLDDTTKILPIFKK